MEMPDIFSQSYIIWFMIGIVFFLLEFIVPGLIIMFFGIGAWITAILCIFFDLGINAQLVVFILTSVLSLIFLRKYFKNIFVGKSGDSGEDLVEDYIGKTAITETEIDPEQGGKIAFKGVSWKAESAEKISVGKRVKIIGKDSIILKIEELK